jgi:hypothetical protein
MNQQYLIRRLLIQKQNLWDEREVELVQHMRLFLSQQIALVDAQLNGLGISHKERPTDEEINHYQGVKSC